ncbi:MAG: putative DNA modification/repair radical SAM protein [Fusicatenibacter sp.]|nr:putative DNA modification/repair radical SAM protein [Lachnospiraceae bacterium]MDY2938499.1 putative DNA modification/repair radical SAM protein [Fusicatenibacter sp.]
MEIISKTLSLQEKLNILADAAKYDVACTSSGVDRKGKKGSLGNSCAAGICHSFAADGRCISLLKILLSNDCVYDCKYCVNRAGNDRVRATFTPEEICQLTVELYRRNYIEGLFLSSGVYKSPNITMEMICRTIELLRTRYHFNGYIHIKAIPGASPELIEKAGYLADRMSVNLELPTKEGLSALAPHKTQRSILRPMRQIQNGISEYRLTQGKEALMERSTGNRYLKDTIFDTRQKPVLSGTDASLLLSSESADSAAAPLSTGKAALSGQPPAPEPTVPSARQAPSKERQKPFVPAGQSTQMIIGATGETDFQLLSTSQYLYQQYDLKRVFYSAYVPLNEDPALPDPSTAPPLLREHRLYQADWLLRYYGFHVQDLLDEQHPSFNTLLDPKCDWALRHLELFPVEINSAEYADLLKVPGIGTKSAMRIVNSRRSSRLSFEHLKRMGVVLKRAKYFITCGGKMMYSMKIEENFITRQLTGENSASNWEIDHPQTYRQLSLFDDFHFDRQPDTSDVVMTATGQL